MTKAASKGIFRDLAVYIAASIKTLGSEGQISKLPAELGYFNSWWKFRRSDSGTIQYEIPWLVFGAIDFLDGYLKKDMVVFEYGSGGSTLFFANRVRQIYSVEHDAAWYQFARAAMEQKKHDNIVYSLIPPDPDPDFPGKKASNHQDHISSRKEYAGMSFEKYASAIDQYPDNSFDLVVVDGRVRASCIAHSMQKVRKGGILLLDNAERSEYMRPFPELLDASKWKLTRFIGHFPFAPASVLNKTYLFEKL